MTTTPPPSTVNMPDEIWLSEYDTCVAFDSEDDCRSIGHTHRPVKYVRTNQPSDESRAREKSEWARACIGASENNQSALREAAQKSAADKPTDESRALAEQPQAVRGWQPISTAPIGATRILLWGKDCEHLCWTNYDDENEWPELATHWQPLPPAPEEK